MKLFNPQTGQMETVKTSFDYPPIPIRSFDWSAYLADNYDEGSLSGQGPTEEAAIADLTEQLKEKTLELDVESWRGQCPVCGHTVEAVYVHEPAVLDNHSSCPVMCAGCIENYTARYGGGVTA